MQYIGYIFFRILVFSFALVPFPVLYIQSDVLRFFLYRVVKYRRAVVFKNLSESFPKKSEKEIEKIAKNFYKHLSDITLESIKGLSLSKKTLLKRYPVKNVELLDEYFSSGQNIIGLASHYGNWEWGVLSFGLQFKHTSVGLYKPLSNKYIERFIKKARAAWGMHLVSFYETDNAFSVKHDKPSLIFMVSDQNPSNIEKAIWIDFLNHDTACLHGAEAYSKKYNLPLVYGDIQRVKRGYYEVTVSKLIENPGDTEYGEITRKYMQFLEDIILKKPENWLWSHKRWKHKRT